MDTEQAMNMALDDVVQLEKSDNKESKGETGKATNFFLLISWHNIASRTNNPSVRCIEWNRSMSGLVTNELFKQWKLLQWERDVTWETCRGEHLGRI